MAKPDRYPVLTIGRLPLPVVERVGKTHGMSLQSRGWERGKGKGKLKVLYGYGHEVQSKDNAPLAGPCWKQRSSLRDLRDAASDQWPLPAIRPLRAFCIGCRSKNVWMQCRHPVDSQ